MSGRNKETLGLPQEWIRRKRDGHVLTSSELQAFVQGVTSGAVSEAQIAAFAMAVYFQDLSVQERVELTLAVRDSGRVLAWDPQIMGGPVLDKHSTGGVGDTVSLMLAPMLAACGAFVPMIAGRGLAHTGGTIDKLEAIPGYQTGVDVAHFQKVVRSCGYAIVRQTDDLAPADRRMYATRDVTATVENLGLITASIVSKKLAAGLDHLVLDVKCGNGAVMQDPAEARLLAESMVAVGRGAGMNTSALLTDMSVPLAWSAGNAVEVHEAVSYLRNDGPCHPRLDEVVMSLGAKLLVQAEMHDTTATAQRQLRQVLDNGRALELFAQSVALMGGDAAVAERPAEVLPQAAVVRPVVVPQAGTLTAYDVRQVGMAVVELGGGRSRPDAAIDPSVGLSQLPLVGTTFSRGDALVTVHAASEQSWEAAQQRLLGAMTFDGEVHLPEAVVGHVG